MKTRRQHGRVRDDLPEEIRAQVNRLLLEPGNTYDDIKAFLADQGFDISRSSIGRYGKDFFGSYQQLKVIEDKSRALVSEAGDGMVLEEAASKLFSQVVIETLMEGKIDVVQIPRILGDFARLQTSTVLRERAKADLKKKVDKTIKDAEKKAENMSKEELLSFIKEKMYGL